MHVFVFRFFPTIESYQSHVQLHQTGSTGTKIAREITREEQYYENVKSLMCPTCGKV